MYEVDFHKTENQKEDGDLVVWTASSKVAKTLPEKGKKIFVTHVKKYFCTVCDYILQKFPINEVIISTKVAVVSALPNAYFSDVRYFLISSCNWFRIWWCWFWCLCWCVGIPILYPIVGRLRRDKKKKKSERIEKQWSLIGKIKNVDGTLKYRHTANIMLSILTIPHSNAECERIFSMVNKTKRKFRSNINDETLEKLIMVKISLQGSCYEQNFEPSFLKKVKSSNLQKTNSFFSPS